MYKIIDENILKERVSLLDSLVYDPSGNTYKQKKKDAIKRIGKENLFDSSEDFDVDIIQDKSKWDRKYSSKLSVKLRRNFCEEGIEHLKEVNQYLNKKEGIVGKKTESSSQNRESEFKNKITYEEKKPQSKLGKAIGRLDNAVGRFFGGTKKKDTRKVEFKNKSNRTEVRRGTKGKNKRTR